MPKFNSIQLKGILSTQQQNHQFMQPQLSTFLPQAQPQQKQSSNNLKVQFVDAIQPQINQQKKVPPRPPQRQSFKNVRCDPEGMQVTAEFQEKKNFQLAVVQQTHKLARESLKPPPINFNFNQQQQQFNLLHQTPAHFKQIPLTNSSNNNHHLNNNQNNFSFGFQNVQQQQQQQRPMFPIQQQQLVHGNTTMMMRMNFMKNHHNQFHHVAATNKMKILRMEESYEEKSDPENHIYEMIDEDEAMNGQNFNFSKHQHHQTQHQQQQPINVDETANKDGNDLFQQLLRAEMLNQMKMCNGSKFNANGRSGYLSHLPQEKRMDVIQETALALATAAYLEK